jgi:hypothetical protein
MDSLIFYIGGAAGPEESDFLPPPEIIPTTALSGMPTLGDQPGADGHWREIVDLVIDYNPTSALSFALNGDFDNEADFSTAGTETWFGVNLGIKYVVADPFAVAVRGEFFHDNHGGIVPINPLSSPSATSSSVESGTLTLSYIAASKLTLMLDNRVDIANSAIFTTKSGADVGKFQFTTTLGAIIATK